MRVGFRLVRNPRAARSKPFVAEVDLDSGELRFLRPVVPEYDRSQLIGGEYELEPGKYYIVRTDESSHKNAVTRYELYHVGKDVECLARITIENRTPYFSDEALKEFYVKSRGAIGALIEYARHHAERSRVSVEDIVRRRLSEYVRRLEEMYNVKIRLTVAVERKQAQARRATQRA